MARQNTNPVTFNRTSRRDRVVGMSSGRAGRVYPIDFIPLLRGDSMSGQFFAELELAEMPKPLLNRVNANVQAWFVPKSAFPYFSGYDEFMYSYQKEPINSLDGQKTPPPFFNTLSGSDIATFENSDFLKVMGLHMANTSDGFCNTDLVDAYNLIWNFRAGAHSTKIPRAAYAQEDLAAALDFKRAFWPTGRHSHIVPDYERALVLGALDLDVMAGQIPISGIGLYGSGTTVAVNVVGHADIPGDGDWSPLKATHPTSSSLMAKLAGATVDEGHKIMAEMGGETVVTSLADIDKARLTQSFAKLRASYAGNDFSGFDPDNVIVAELMQGFRVPRELFQRPWLVDSKRVTFGMAERHATDAANLDQSVTVGKTMAQLSLNVPAQDTGGYIVITVEVLPDRLNERQGDWCLYLNDPDQYPNALRDIQRPEPVDLVSNWRIDARHSNLDGLYGYEPMNAIWERDFSRLGGDFYQADPANPFKEARAGIWTPNMVDPAYTVDHWLAPDPFPHDVFSDTTASAFEIAFSHSAMINGITQIGDALVENNDDYSEVQAERATDAV